jgi:hypothetical protein
MPRYRRAGSTRDSNDHVARSTHSAYVSAFTSAAASALASGFLTQPDYSAAVAAAQSSVP